MNKLMNFNRTFIKNSSYIAISSALLASSVSLAFAWTEPTLTPPAGNVSLNSSQWTTSSSDIYYTTGNVGIGTASPGVAKLRLSGTPYVYQAFDVSGTSFGYLGSAGAFFGGQSQTDFGIYGSSHNVMIGGRNSPDLVVNTSGKVGIGTTTPAQLLSVEGVIYSGTGGFKFPDGTTQTTAASGSGSQWTTTGSDIYYTTGKVGIGTNGPTNNLYVVASTGQSGITIRQNSSGASNEATLSLLHSNATGFGALLGVENNAGDFHIDMEYNGGFINNALYIKSTNANVGVRTTNPKAPLQVYSAVVTTATQIPAASGTTPLNPMARFDNNRGEVLDIGGQWASPYAIWLQATDASALGTYYPLLLNPNGGDVGIGTSAPGSSAVTGLGFSYSAALHVNGSARPSPTFSGTGVDFRFIDTNASANVKAGDIVYDDQIFKFRGLTDAGAAKNDPTLAVDTNIGRVGIGTTTPAQIFSVQGNSLISGNLSVAGITATGTVALKTFTETISATGNSGASATINFALGSVNTITLTANTTLSFSNATAGQSVTIFLKQDATGSRTVTWPTMLWSGGTAPTLTTTAAKTDIVTVFYDGTNYYGFLGGTNY